MEANLLMAMMMESFLLTVRDNGVHLVAGDKCGVHGEGHQLLKVMVTITLSISMLV